MFKKISITPHAIDYVATMIVVSIQVLIVYFGNDYSKFIFDFIEDTFGHLGFGMIVIPLLSVITYSLYFGNSKLSFIVGFLSTITPQVYFILFLGGLDFILKFPQTFIATFVLGLIFGLIGMLFSMIKKNSGIITRISINIAVLISVLGIHTIFGQSKDIGFWLSFNSALMIGLSLSYYTLHDVKKAFIFTFLTLIMIFLIIIKSPLNIIFLYRALPENLFIGIIIAVMLGAILKVYTYYREHKTRG